MATEASKRFRELIASLGRPTLGALFPGEFEVYMMTLELVDSSGDTADYFSFPVMPDEIVKSEVEVTNVKKTAGGTISLVSNTYTPEDITLTGNFGRSFKVLIGTELIDFKAFGQSFKALKGGNLSELQNPFDAKIKTGYGCTKLLQNIAQKSLSLDDKGKPYKLFLYNPSLGESYLVEKSSLVLRMDKNTNNRMWGYSITFQVLAPSDLLGTVGASSLLKTLGMGALQGGVNILAGKIGEIIREDASNPIATQGKRVKGLLDKVGNSITKGITG